jgi:hypothetical protein
VGPESEAAPRGAKGELAELESRDGGVHVQA